MKTGNSEASVHFRREKRAPDQMNFILEYANFFTFSKKNAREKKFFFSFCFRLFSKKNS